MMKKKGVTKPVITVVIKIYGNVCTLYNSVIAQLSKGVVTVFATKIPESEGIIVHPEPVTLRRLVKIAKINAKIEAMTTKIGEAK